MKQKRIGRIAVVVVIVALAACLIYFSFWDTMPQLLSLLKDGDAAALEAYLQSIDSFSGLMCLALLQALQVVSVVLPGAPIQIAGGIVYGTWRSFFICHLSSVAANVTVFAAARRLGRKLDALMPAKKKSSRLDFLLKSENPAYMTAVACLVPILPNGFIPYVAAKTKIRPLHFGLAIYFGSFMPVLILCAVGSKILQGGYVASAILLAALFAVVLVLAINKNRILRLLKTISARYRRAG
jgi:uncharacterized membrane protein YdjX (TVP38/TMEM64 family)